MRWRYARCGRAVVGYCHGRNNVAIQQGGAPVIAYRDATSVTSTTRAQTSIANFPTPRQGQKEGPLATYATMDVLPPGPTPTTVQEIAST